MREMTMEYRRWDRDLLHASGTVYGISHLIPRRVVLATYRMERFKLKCLRVGVSRDPKDQTRKII